MKTNFGYVIGWGYALSIVVCIFSVTIGWLWFEWNMIWKTFLTCASISIVSWIVFTMSVNYIHDSIKESKPDKPKKKSEFQKRLENLADKSARTKRNNNL